MRISEVDRVIAHIPVKVGFSICKPNRILRRPSADLCIVVTCAESRQTRVLIVESAGEAEGLDGIVRIADDCGDIPKLIVVQPLHYSSRAGVYDQSR